MSGCASSTSIAVTYMARYVGLKGADGHSCCYTARVIDRVTNEVMCETRTLEQADHIAHALETLRKSGKAKPTFKRVW